LAVASGKFIENRLSTHSSAGNHLIVEAVGLFWIGCALEGSDMASRWMQKSRLILREQVCRQIHPDGTNQEQSFWYLGFVLDALFHYFLLEKEELIPDEVRDRLERMIDFVAQTTSPDGSFPDYGDRDDGFVFRIDDDYVEYPFPGLLTIGGELFGRPEWFRKTERAMKRLTFWRGNSLPKSDDQPATGLNKISGRPVLVTFRDGGMTLMRWDKSRILFRHSRLGLANTAGHGHADALSVLFSWNTVPVLIDLGSGQYNGDQTIRNFFRSTIAHNTVEVNGRDQAKMLGPFLWETPYETDLLQTGTAPVLFAEARHNGYVKEFGIAHTRRVELVSPNQWILTDQFSNVNNAFIRGAFHFGPCKHVIKKENCTEVIYSEFAFSVTWPPGFNIEVFFGSQDPFMGWRSTVYGKWEPIYSVSFSSEIKQNASYSIALKIES
jgi:hypothetical protein